MQHIVGSLRWQRQAVCSRFPSCSIDLETSAPTGAVTATWTTSERTFVTYKISSGVCCPVGGSSSRAEDSDIVTAHSVGASASPGVARSVCNLGERRGPRADDQRAVVVGCDLHRDGERAELDWGLGQRDLGSVSGRKTVRDLMDDWPLARQCTPHIVSAVKTDRCPPAMLAVMILLGPVKFRYVKLLRGAEHGGFEAVQRVLPGLLGRHPSNLHLRWPCHSAWRSQPPLGAARSRLRGGRSGR